MWSLLPDDIIVNIFARLPVKSILRFRCVCKSWFKLLTDPYFVKTHLNHNSIENNNLHIMLEHHDLIYSIRYNDLSSLSDHAVERINYPLKSAKHGFHILGSCNGLVCIQSNKDNNVCFWNPSTQEYKVIPSTPIKSTVAFTVYGFGYDCKTEDYKLVKIAFSIEDDESDAEVMVYTLGSNSWGSIQNFPYELVCGDQPGVLVNGALHWLAFPSFGSRSLELIVSFDIGDEIFQEVPQSEHFDFNFNRRVGMLGECLCIFGSGFIINFEVWVMKDYGVRESWTKLFTIAQPTPFGSLMCLKPMWSFKNGEFLLQKGRCTLVLYDPKHETAKKLKFRGISEWFQMETYVRTLVSLNSGTYMRQ